MLCDFILSIPTFCHIRNSKNILLDYVYDYPASISRLRNLESKSVSSNMGQRDIIKMVLQTAQHDWAILPIKRVLNLIFSF